jgi:hypothetical protein
LAPYASLYLPVNTAAMATSLSSLSVAGSGFAHISQQKTAKKCGVLYLLFLLDLYPTGWSPFLTGVAIFLCLLSSLQLAYLTQVQTISFLATREYGMIHRGPGFPAVA